MHTITVALFLNETFVKLYILRIIAASLLSLQCPLQSTTK